NAGTYLLDPNRTALCGASAGAQLAMMAAYTQGVPVYEGADLAETCKVLAVVEQFGSTDFLKTKRHFDESGFARANDPEDPEPDAVDVMLGAKTQQMPDLVRFMNPIDNVHPGIPPTMLLHGRYDPVVPYQQAEELFEKIRRVAGQSRAELYIDDVFLHADPGYAEKEWGDRIFGFLDKYLK
ncbi:MAG: prolyl oligopeptidase family serine peptidase, partial [Oscillospiraceae bacterium]|nr:prolyl oligopeptidase family serine peptidase [Oscillospiraceae bacterium]